MTKPEHYILAPGADQADLSGSRLWIEINHRFFHYLLLGNDKRLLALKYYSFSPAAGRSGQDMLEDILAGDDLLQKNIPVHMLIYNTAESHLVPASVYQSRLNKDLFQLVHGDLKPEQLLSEEIDGMDIQNVFRVDAGIHRLMQYKFDIEHIKHYYSLWITCSGKDTAAEPDRLELIFYSHEFLVKLVKDGKLQLIQRFAYQTAEDVGYYLLNIYHQYRLSCTQVPIEVSGMIARDSAMYEELLKYFLLVETASAPEEFLPDAALAEYPDHFFSPFLKMALCVS